MWRRWLAWTRSEQLHEEIADERDFHIAMAAEELVRRGMSEPDAQAAARQKFGAPLRMQEEGFDVRGGWLADVAGDVRVAARMLRKTPARTAALVATVALAIGVNTAVFSVVKSVVLDPLPFPAASELVTLHQVSKGQASGVSYPNFEDWRAAATGFSGMAVWAPDTATLTARGGAERVRGAVVSAGLFGVLGVAPLRGRLFAEAEDAPASERVALISDALWRAQFDGRDDAVGQSLHLDGAAYRVVGVLASTSAFPIASEPVSYWITVAGDAAPSPWGGSIRTSRSYPRYEAALARLRPGVSMAQARAQLGPAVRVSPAIDDVVGQVAPLLWTLYAAVFCVLAVGCANAATILLVGAVARGREFALRAALGARPARLARQLMVESLVVAMAGGACGAVLAWALVSGFARVAPAELPRLGAVGADSAMLLYALAVSLLTGLAFGVVPAAAGVRQDLIGVLRSGRAPGKRRLGTVLIAGQIAVSMLLGCCAAALTGSFWRILHTPRGFDPAGVLTASVSLPPTHYPSGSPAVTRFYEDLLAELRRAPGVVSAAVAQSLPLSGQNNSTRVDVVGAPESKLSADLRFVDPAYFRTLRIPLFEGRGLEATDRPGRPAIVVVNHAFVRQFHVAVGSRLKLGWGGDAPKTIVGVVGDIRHRALGSVAAPEMYVPVAQFPVSNLAIVLRGPADSGRTLREAVRRLDVGVPVEDVRTLSEHLLLSAAPQRFLMWVLVALAASALLLAAIGLYGALSYSTVCRRHEFGVRMALGSDGWGIMRLVLGEGLGTAIAGMAAGLALTAGAARFVEAWLYETKALDAVYLAGAGAVLLAVAVAACWGPARRATRVSPVISLRGE